MSRARLPLWIALGFVLFGLVRLVLVFDALPEVVASHFDGSGHPNGHQSKLAFALTAALLQAMFGLMTWAAPSMIRNSRDELLNLPHKGYWLAPERRDATKQRLSEWTSWFCCATLGLMTGVFELVIRGNQHEHPQLSPQVWLLLVSYVGFMLVSGIALVRGFRVPADDAGGA
jgi:serine/threonine-protein kinase